MEYWIVTHAKIKHHTQELWEVTRAEMLLVWLSLHKKGFQQGNWLSNAES